VCAQRWQDPKNESRLEDALERLLEEIAGPRWDEGEHEVRVAAVAVGQQPSVDVERASGHYRIVAEVPGVTAKSLRLRAASRALVIEGVWPTAPAKAVELLLQETRRGAFRRIVELPGPADGHNARAVLQNGMLEVLLPVALAEEEEGEVTLDIA